MDRDAIAVLENTNLASEIKNGAIKIAKKFYKEGNLTNRTPRVFVAGCAYIASRETNPSGKLTQREISHIFGCTKVSVRNSYKEIISVIEVPK